MLAELQKRAQNCICINQLLFYKMTEKRKRFKNRTVSLLVCFKKWTSGHVVLLFSLYAKPFFFLKRPLSPHSVLRVVTFIRPSPLAPSLFRQSSPTNSDFFSFSLCLDVLFKFSSARVRFPWPNSTPSRLLKSTGRFVLTRKSSRKILEAVGTSQLARFFFLVSFFL